jgi:hypothetical protein
MRRLGAVSDVVDAVSSCDSPAEESWAGAGVPFDVVSETGGDGVVAGGSKGVELSSATELSVAAPGSEVEESDVLCGATSDGDPVVDDVDICALLFVAWPLSLVEVLAPPDALTFISGDVSDVDVVLVSAAPPEVFSVEGVEDWVGAVADSADWAVALVEDSDGESVVESVDDGSVSARATPIP